MKKKEDEDIELKGENRLPFPTLHPFRIARHSLCYEAKNGLFFLGLT